MNKIKFGLLIENATNKILRATAKANEGMETHFSDKDAYLWVEEGKVLFRINDTQQQLEGQQGVNIPANTAHSLTVMEDCNVLLILHAKAKIRFTRDVE